MNPTTTNQMMTEVLQFCIDHPSARDVLFAMAGPGAGAYQVVKLWLAMEAINGKTLAIKALTSMIELQASYQ